jgi:hypothetical protein
LFLKLWVKIINIFFINKIINKKKRSVFKQSALYFEILGY